MVMNGKLVWLVAMASAKVINTGELDVWDWLDGMGLEQRLYSSLFLVLILNFDFPFFFPRAFMGFFFT